VIGVRKPGLTRIVPFIDVLIRVSMRIVTMPIQSQGIITRDNVSVDVSAVAYYRVVDATKAVVAIENVASSTIGELGAFLSREAAAATAAAQAVTKLPVGTDRSETPPAGDAES
jgi:regulator of protease activity HflC (stomatin/prohibitin superfamily)